MYTLVAPSSSNPFDEVQVRSFTVSFLRVSPVGGFEVEY